MVLQTIGVTEPVKLYIQHLDGGRNTVSEDGLHA